jgi:potassium-transporting ATPase potassium-binding subunit
LDFDDRVRIGWISLSLSLCGAAQAGVVLMTANTVFQIGLYFALLLACVKPLGLFMARVYLGRSTFLDRMVAPVERFFYRIAAIDPDLEMTWRQYASALMTFSVVSVLAVYAVLRLQGFLPMYPESLPAVSPDLAFNTAVSFATNTNWQAYGGETTMSYVTQMTALTVQNFLSAAAGMAVLVALIRAFTRQESPTIGNFWVDLVRGTLYILLPLSIILALCLVTQGVVQTISPYQEVALMEPAVDAQGQEVTTQRIAVGPAASQIAIKQLGTNGGGFFNANSAHPFENPTPLSNLLQMVAILLIPAALCGTFGEMIRDRRQGWAILAAMSAILIVMLGLSVVAEQSGNPVLGGLGVDQTASDVQSGETWKGKRPVSGSRTRHFGPSPRPRPPTVRSIPCTIHTRHWAAWPQCG